VIGDRCSERCSAGLLDGVEGAVAVIRNSWKLLVCIALFLPTSGL
jgi:hypothetical protein